MKKAVKLILALIFISSMFSCDKAPQQEPLTLLPDSIKGGIFVLNEGNFNKSNATLDYIDMVDNKYYNDVYKVANGKALGDVLQSMNIINDNVYLVVNNSSKIEVINKNTFKSIATISNLLSPRYIIQVSTNTAYVSDEYDNTIAVLDLPTHNIIKKIKTKTWTERMLLIGNKVWVTAPFSNSIFSINIFTNEIQDSLQLSYGTNYIQPQNDSIFWVLCSGDAIKKINASLYKIKTQNDTFSITKQFEFAAQKRPSHLLIDSKSNTLFWLNTNIYKMNVNDSVLPQSPFVYADGKNFYSMAYNKKQNEIYVSDALDFIQKSKVYRYQTDNGLLKGRFDSGIITGDFYFNY